MRIKRKMLPTCRRMVNFSEVSHQMHSKLNNLKNEQLLFFQQANIVHIQKFTTASFNAFENISIFHLFII